MHEHTAYTYNGDAPITGLTAFELDKLQLGFIVRSEQQNDAMSAQAAGTSTMTQSNKRQHKQSIAQRVRAQ